MIRIEKDAFIVEQAHAVYYTNFNKYNENLMECDEYDLLTDELNTSIRMTKAELKQKMRTNAKLQMYWECEE